MALRLSSPGPGTNPGADCKPGSVPARERAGEDHSSRRRIAAPLVRSTRTPAPALRPRSRTGRPCGVPIRVCSGRGLPRRRSPGCRAWALTPRFHPYLCPAAEAARPSAVWFLRRFPSSRLGSPLTTSLPYGARTFLPRAPPESGPASDPPSASDAGILSQVAGLREGRGMTLSIRRSVK